MPPCPVRRSALDGGGSPRRACLAARTAILTIVVIVALAVSGCTSVDASAGSQTAGQPATQPADPPANPPTDPSADPSASGGAAAGSGSLTDPSAEVLRAVNTLVSQRAVAVAGRDKAAWLGTLSDPSSAFGTAQAGLFERLVSLPVSGLTAREVAVAPASPTGTATGTAAGTATGTPTTAAGPPPSVPAAGSITSSGPADAATAATAWVANVRLAYRFTGYDRGDRGFAVSYEVTRTGDGWRLSGTGPGRTDAQPFDLPAATSVSSPSALVIGDVPQDTLQTYLELGEAARGRIEQAWGSARPSVIVAPRTSAELQTQLGRGAVQGLDQVAAITDGPLPAGEPAPSDRVYLNPDAFSKLSANGRSVVVTHELTHVTVRGSTTRAAPIWLSEGYADEVAFASSGLPERAVAADLLTKVRTGDVPSALPKAADFDPSRGVIAPTYNAAWLAVVLLRQTYGQVKLNGFYRAIAGGPTADPSVTGSSEELTQQAFVGTLGLTQDQFVGDWKAFLAKLAR